MCQRLTASHKCSVAFLCCICAFALWPPRVTAAQQADLGNEISLLAKKLLDDPLDAAAAERLGQLRQQQEQARNAALGALVKGLQAYVQHRLDEAGQELAKAAQASDVVTLADSVLQTSLSRVIEECRREPKSPSGPTAQEVCPRCGNTGWADCPACYGSGVLLCPNCGGNGKFSRSGGICSNRKCRRTGALACEKCGGKGLVPCEKCGRTSATVVSKGTAFLTADQVAAIMKAIAMARNCRGGGIDLDSPAALRTSPKVGE